VRRSEPAPHIGLRRLGPLLLILPIGCTTTHSVRTVGKGNLEFETTLGGPMTTSLGPPAPIPNAFVGARYGILDDLDFSAHYNLTAPIVPGIGLDLQTAVHWIPIQPGLARQQQTPEYGWSLGGGLGITWISDFRSGLVVLPYLEAAVGWRHAWFNPFAGTALGLNLYRPPGREHVMQLSPFLGVELILPRGAALSLRLTWHDVTYNAYGSQVDWIYMIDDVEAEEKRAPLGVSLGFSIGIPLGRER